MSNHNVSNAQRFRHVSFYLAARGNDFMRDIAEIYRYGFEQLGLSTQVFLDRVPPMDPAPDELCLVVAPHEYQELFLSRERLSPGSRGPLAGAFLLNTEQPGSVWFKKARQLAKQARGVFDINQTGACEFRRLGIPAHYAPIGYAPLLEGSAGAIDGLNGDRPVDITFLGVSTERREQFLSDEARRLNRYQCRLLLAPLQVTRHEGGPFYVGGEERSRLLQRSKILLNLHAAGRPYFEWHRVACALANGCLYVSETSQGFHPLVPGEHFVMADVRELMDRCEFYLQHPDARLAVVEQGKTLLRQRLSAEMSCEGMLQFAQTHQPKRGLWGSFSHEAAEWVRSAATLCAQKGPRLVSKIRRKWARLRRRTAFRQVDQRRAALLERLGRSAQMRAEGHAVYSIESNAAAAERSHPELAVVVTLYNYQAFIRECLDSVQQSDLESIPGGAEVIVVDDASTDRSAGIVHEYMQTSRLPLRLVRKTFNTGLADARNIGLEVTRAPYVFILDADNYVLPRCFSALHGALTASKAAAAYGMIAKFDGGTRAGSGLLSQFAWDVRKLVQAPYIDAMAMFDRNKLLGAGGYSVDLLAHGWLGWEDYDLWLKLAQRRERPVFVPQIVAGYRAHAQSMIHTTELFRDRFVQHFHDKFSDLLDAACGADDGLHVRYLFGRRRRGRPPRRHHISVESQRREPQNLNLTLPVPRE